jgi:hypothetical protein
MEDAFFSIPGDVVRDAEAAAEFKLVVPPDAKASPRSPESFFWMEGGRITTANSDSYLSPEGLPVLTLQIDVAIDNSGSGVNTGRNVGTTFRISNKAIQSKGPKNLLTMSLMSLAKLKGMFATLGIEPDREDGGFSGPMLKNYFPPSVSGFPADPSTLLNQDVYFQVKQAPFESKDGSTRTRAEISKFLPRG